MHHVVAIQIQFNSAICDTSTNIILFCQTISNSLLSLLSLLSGWLFREKTLTAVK